MEAFLHSIFLYPESNAYLHGVMLDHCIVRRRMMRHSKEFGMALFATMDFDYELSLAFRQLFSN